MKRIFLAVLALLALSTLASAQAVDPAVQAAVEAAVPAQYAGYTSLALIALMMLGRWIKALQNGTGIKGWFSAIWFGTNTPKLVIACLCLLSLPSCQTAAGNERLARIVDLSLDVAQRKGVISAEDAAAVREAGTILLQPDAAPVVIVDTTSGK